MNSEQALLCGNDSSVYARTDVEFAQNVLHMNLDGGFCNTVLAANFFVAGAARNATQYVAFAR